MPLDASTVGDRTQEWQEQLRRIALPRALMGGTEAMRAGGKAYLPARVKESTEEYDVRLSRAVLLNEFKRTVNYLSGQVFQKPAKYQEGENAQSYDEAFFTAFQEDVDTQGNNLSMFTEKVFREAVIDGISFVLSDYSRVTLRQNEDGSVYRDVNNNTQYLNNRGEWQVKTAEADTVNGWRPYWVIIKASQVLDAWMYYENGQSRLRAFRYLEVTTREKDNGEREAVNRVRAIYPDHWEVWESFDGRGYEKVAEGINGLGYVPVDWFMPGEEIAGLTAQPALDDLAWMNLSHWQAYSDHTGLMTYGRAPVWFGRKMRGYDERGKPVDMEFGPGRYITTDQDGADLHSVGVDASSIDKSFQDLQTKQDYMGLYGLQLIMPKSSGTTATQAQIAAASSDSTLKGWVQKLQDCMENALKKIAQWQGQEDGPALYINSEFRLPYDAAALQQEAQQQRDGQSPLFVLYEMKKKMGIISEDMTFERYVSLIDEDKKRQAEADQVYNPQFENFAGQNARNTNNQPRQV